MRIVLAFVVVLVVHPLAAQSRPEPKLGPDDSRNLFDGQSLDGWVDRGGRYDGTARWSAEDGAIVGRQGPRQSGGLLYTADAYRNFIVTLETRIDWPFDSGIFLRMSKEGKGAQVTLDYRETGEIGGIYSDGYLHHNRGGKARWIPDAWNRFTVRCVGEDMHLTVWMNGELITDYQLPAGSKGYARTGLIGVQVHGGAHIPDTQAARFRNLRVRELPEFEADEFHCDDHGRLAPTPAAVKAGWTSLFNGRDLSGWTPQGPKNGYVIEDGLLHFGRGGGGELRTDADYRDFELRLDFKTARMANSGVMLRASRAGGNPSFSGCEVQILDDFNWEKVTGTTLKPWQFCGSLYGAVPPGDRGALNPIGSWNSFRIRYEGSRLAVRLNGSTLYDVDTYALKVDPPFAKRAETGFIALQRYDLRHADVRYGLSFRNLFVRRIEGR